MYKTGGLNGSIIGLGVCLPGYWAGSWCGLLPQPWAVVGAGEEASCSKYGKIKNDLPVFQGPSEAFSILQ